MITAVHVPPDVDDNSALGYLYRFISLQQSIYPEAVHIIARDFNYMDIRAVLSEFLQHMNCNVIRANILDKVYPNNKLRCRARPLPHLGQSDHMSLLFITVYPPRETALTTTRIVKTWPDDASQQLQDCFDRTCWDIFEHQIIDTVLCYIRTCTNIVTLEECIQVYPNLDDQGGPAAALREEYCLQVQ